MLGDKLGGAREGRGLGLRESLTGRWGLGSEKEGGGQSLERGKCVRPGSAGRATGSEPEGNAKPRSSPWLEKPRGEGAEWLPLPPGWPSVGYRRLEGRGGHF